MLKAKNRETETGPLSPTHYKAFDTKHLQRQPHNHIHTKLNSSSSTFNTTPLQKFTVKKKTTNLIQCQYIRHNKLKPSSCLAPQSVRKQKITQEVNSQKRPSQSGIFQTG